LALNWQANQVAGILLRQCVDREKNIGLLFEQGASMIVGILGVLKAGLTYVPLAPELPVKRLVYILQDSQARLLLTHDKNLALAQELMEGTLAVINIDRATTKDCPYNDIMSNRLPSCIAKKFIRYNHKVLII
jgi:non-ribosomal peptide synthetase component F